MATKKELEVYNEYNEHLCRLRFIGGGQLPAALEGRYTSTKEAEKMRDLYYAGKLPKRPLGIRPVAEVEAEKTK